MNKSETMKLLQIITVAYPATKMIVDDLTIDIWYEMLSDMSYAIVMAATKRMLATQKFPPTIADIRESVANAVQDAKDEPTAGEAWRLVRKAIGKFGSYQPTEARAWLGEKTWHAVEMIGGWQYICLSEDGVDIQSAQFERRYKVAREQEKNQVQIPAAVRESMQALTGGILKRLESNTEIDRSKT